VKKTAAVKKAKKPLGHVRMRGKGNCLAGSGIFLAGGQVVLLWRDKHEQFEGGGRRLRPFPWPSTVQK